MTELNICKKPVRSASRHGPTSRAPLSGIAIRRAALAIADRLGLEALTIRRLAADLGVTPMAVYRYFPGMSAIENTLVDLVVDDYGVTVHDETDIGDWLRTTFVAMRQALCEHPGVTPLLSGASYSAGRALLVLEQVLLRLRRAGIDGVMGAQLFHALMAYTIGSVILMSNAPRGEKDNAHGMTPADPSEDRRLAFEALDEKDYPCVVETASQLARQLGGEGFVIGLDAIMQGILGVPGQTSQ